VRVLLLGLGVWRAWGGFLCDGGVEVFDEVLGVGLDVVNEDWPSGCCEHDRGERVEVCFLDGVGKAALVETAVVSAFIYFGACVGGVAGQDDVEVWPVDVFVEVPEKGEGNTVEVLEDEC